MKIDGRERANIFHSLFRRKEKQTLTQPQASSQFVFQDHAVVDVTFLDAVTPEEPLGYLCGGLIQLSSDGHLLLYADAEKRVLEDISLVDLIAGSNHINHFDPEHLTEVSLTTSKRNIRISFRNEAVKKAFWNTLTSVYDNVRARTDAGMPECSDLVGYQYSVTGGLGCCFLRGNAKLVTVSSSAVPSSPVTIHGDGIHWESPYFDDTLVPGVSRYVFDKTTGDTVCKISFIRFGQFRLNDSVFISCGTDAVVFYRNDQPIARITRCQGKKLPIPALLDPHFDWTPSYEISVSESVGNELLLVICAFPMLRFA